MTYQINSWKNKAIQNQAFATELPPAVTSGEIGPGPMLFGAHARATIVAMEPSTWDASRVKAMCTRVRVWRRIMPKPRPCRASRIPSQSHKLRDASAPLTELPAQGRKRPIPETPHHIWAQRGAPRPHANTGRIQLWRLERYPNMVNTATQMTPKKTMTRMPTCQASAWFELQRTV